MGLPIPHHLAEKASSFPESSYGATTVTLVLSDGRRVPRVLLAGGSDIVKIGDRKVTDASELDFGLSDIHGVVPETRGRMWRRLGVLLELAKRRLGC